MSSDTSLQMVQVALHWAWDPIGVRGIEEAADEYDMYAPRVLELLKADAPVEQIADYPTSVVRDRMERPLRPDRDKDVSSMLQQMFVITRQAERLLPTTTRPFAIGKAVPVSCRAAKPRAIASQVTQIEPLHSSAGMVI